MSVKLVALAFLPIVLFSCAPTVQEQTQDPEPEPEPPADPAYEITLPVPLDQVTGDVLRAVSIGRLPYLIKNSDYENEQGELNMQVTIDESGKVYTIMVYARGDEQTTIRIEGNPDGIELIVADFRLPKEE